MAISLDSTGRTSGLCHGRRHGPRRRGEVDLIAAHGCSGTGTATVRFEPEYHRFVDLPNT
ncbi:hypothetical protein [Streptomyces clavifer]|uniref:hypothetical protein n=1 Tax=Streptomyces clavifer TaxID=68188 RepID=UPI0036CCF5DA